MRIQNKQGKYLLLALALCLQVAFLAACGNTQNEQLSSLTESAPQQEVEPTNETIEEEVNDTLVLKAADATTTGKGYNSDGEHVDTVYVDGLDIITNIGTSATVTYTIPDGVDGTFDVYVEISKTAYPYGSTPFGIAVNEGAFYNFQVKILGVAPDFSDLFDKGTFLALSEVSLKSGDTITVKGNEGFEMEWDGVMSSVMPALGNIQLHQHGANVEVGYASNAAIATAATSAGTALSNKEIIWLGSSVTYGTATDNGDFSIVEVLSENHPGLVSHKHATAGTTLVNLSSSSYVSRMMEIDPQINADLFVVQLSTNDATMGVPLGEIQEGFATSDFDDTTIVGAIETIIAYASETWNCPVVFYTGTYYDSPEYAEMVDMLGQLKEKWSIEIIDLWNNEGMTALYGTEQYDEYMSDNIHPNVLGYREWWGPIFDETLQDILSK